MFPLRDVQRLTSVLTEVPPSLRKTLKQIPATVPSSSPPAPASPASSETSKPPPEATALLSKVFGPAKPSGLSGLLQAAVQQQQQPAQSPQPPVAAIPIQAAPQGKQATLLPCSGEAGSNRGSLQTYSMEQAAGACVTTASSMSRCTEEDSEVHVQYRPLNRDSESEDTADDTIMYTLHLEDAAAEAIILLITRFSLYRDKDSVPNQDLLADF
ncbi:hypothetical protein B566_EDAN011345 [Ephemera danica]|nr:hypothetical protein B566_EDAN011345 [Ephemera danica]